jgi:hypothetical protein
MMRPRRAALFPLRTSTSTIMECSMIAIDYLDMSTVKLGLESTNDT